MKYIRKKKSSKRNGYGRYVHEAKTRKNTLKGMEKTLKLIVKKKKTIMLDLWVIHPTGSSKIKNLNV